MYVCVFDANWEIPSNSTMQVPNAKFLKNASGTTCWPKLATTNSYYGVKSTHGPVVPPAMFFNHPPIPTPGAPSYMNIYI